MVHGHLLLLSASKSHLLKQSGRSLKCHNEIQMQISVIVEGRKRRVTSLIPPVAICVHMPCWKNPQWSSNPLYRN